MDDRTCTKRDVIHSIFNAILMISLIVSIKSPWYEISKCITEGTAPTVCVSTWQNPERGNLDPKITNKFKASLGLTIFALLLVFVILAILLVKAILKKLKKEDIYKLLKKVSTYIFLALHLLLVIVISASCFNFTSINKLYCADGDEDPKETYICDNFRGKQTIISDAITEYYSWGPSAGFVFSTISTVLSTGFFGYLVFSWWRNRNNDDSSISSSSSSRYPSSSSSSSGYSKVGQESLISDHQDEYDE
ncbi:hypothetical protein DFA_11525 [Cavenderia fasciculata]|uniref:Transmembrane protein n=1 Tax=Cavenderia fasciculata TaxID=261658 RepID=F4QDD6_CACFS|nr:uncharacterized protein DFA_11525 [Cavenderia fasciculata]EGG13764.1 hypothetical protein DFA_11525 [Cavenderia fasciculata]|eukprot:XP_004350472.1 hypothetical protein DFA_11525 [Cavenderia fasciculata]